MNARDVLALLPAALDWMVLFRLSELRRVADEATVRAMFFLRPQDVLDGVSHVVLTSRGRCLALEAGGPLVPASDAPLEAGADAGGSLLEAHAAALAALPAEDPGCLGLGRLPPLAPAFLHVAIRDGVGEAQALFESEPDRRHWDLLPAVGVEPLGGEPRGGFWLARFRNRLPTHVRAGALAGFARTQHCNDFFLRHGRVDETLAEGLRRASEDRVRAAREGIARILLTLADAASRRPLPMRCVPPPPEQPFDYGDLVPLGFLLRGLGALPPPGGAEEAERRAAALGALEQRVLAARTDGLWAFHSERLVTATDSALVLLGLREPAAVEALERFAVAPGAYLPQLASEEPRAGHMRAGEENRHWRQPDFATGCLIAGLRAEAGLPRRVPLGALSSGFEARAGLYFANPWLVDFCLAHALAGDPEPEAAALRRRLERELLASVNPDGSFGSWDRALSTALALATLARLGYRGRLVRVAQLRLLEELEAPEWPVSTPFYSTFVVPASERPGAEAPVPEQHLAIGGELHELSLYRDRFKLVLGGLASLALAAPCDLAEPDPELRAHSEVHPRYRCASLDQYVARFALPPYLGAQALAR